MKRMLMRSEGEEAEELTLQRMKTTRSSGKPSKRSDSSSVAFVYGGDDDDDDDGVVFCFFLICFGLVFFVCVFVLFCFNLTLYSVPNGISKGREEWERGGIYMREGLAF